MRQNQKPDGDPGRSISVPIPAQDPKLYGKKATNDILLFLSSHRSDQFTQRELARQVEYSEPTVRRTVDILEENDLVGCEYEGNQKLVKINRSRLSIPDDPILRIPQEEFHKPVEVATEKIQTELESVVGIILHGSVARGEADRRSDIDFWVLVQKERPLNQREANLIENDLEDRAFDGQRYDFHISVESVDSVPAFADDIWEIIQTGIPVYKTETLQKIRNLLAHDQLNE